MPDSDQNLHTVVPLGSVQGLSPVSDRVVRKKKQQQKQQKRHQPTNIDEQLQEEEQQGRNEKKGKGGEHIDFHA